MSSPLFVAAAVALLAFVARWYLKRRAYQAAWKDLPGPPSVFLLGNMKSAIKLTLSTNLLHPYPVYLMQLIMGHTILYRKHGFYMLWMSSKPVISAFSPHLLEKILSSNVSLEKSFEYTFLHKWLGTGLLTSTDSKWRSRRKLLTPSFHFRILDDFLPVFHDQSMVLVRKLRSRTDEIETVDIKPLVVLCTLDIVCETVMGASIGAQDGENSEYVTAVRILAESFGERTSKPWLFSDFLFNLSSEGKLFHNTLQTVHDFTDKVIRKKKESLLRLRENAEQAETGEAEGSPKKRKALMDLLLDLHLDGEQLGEEDIREEVDTFMFEGHDTTALGITYALYCIGLYPEVQRRLADELDSIFGDDRDRPVTMDDVREMKYLECILKESQRIYPSVPMIGRMLNEDINYNGMTIPKGTTCHVNIISIHHDPESFPNPSVFDPDRFTPENAVGRHPYAFIPFSAGPRNCIGQKFAMLEEKVVISNILRHYEVVSIDPRDKVHVCFEFTLKTTGPIRMKFMPRRL